jgi:hypothetical protein
MMPGAPSTVTVPDDRQKNLLGCDRRVDKLYTMDAIEIGDTGNNVLIKKIYSKMS